jgi:hypothetical protein
MNVDSSRLLLISQQPSPVGEFSPIKKNNAVNKIQGVEEIIRGSSSHTSVDLLDPKNKFHKNKFNTDLFLKYLEKLIEQRDEKGFIEFFESLKEKKEHILASQLIEQLLKNHSSQDKQASLENYHFIDNVIRAVYSAIDEHFVIGNLIKVLGRTLMGPKGMELIIEDLKSKGSLKNKDTSEEVPCCVCPDLSAFKEKLRFLFLKKSELKVQRCCFLVIGENSHVTPVYVENKEGHYRTLITDSMGKENGFYTFHIQWIIGNVFSDFPEEKVNSYVYLGTARQHDPSNCSVFSIRDVTKISQHSEEILKWAEEHSISKFHENCMVIDALPPVMMKTAQSISMIEQYQKDHGLQVDLKPVHRRMKKDSKGMEREYNFKVRDLFRKYEQKIIVKVIQIQLAP